MTNVTTKRGEGTSTWTVAAAKARFSEVVDRARTEGPQLITRNGHRAAVVVGADEWDRRTRRVGNLADFFASSPLREVPELEIERARDLPREDVL
jgi:prevent-host-death family protein